MKQITMIALYGQKQGDLERLIKDCWTIIGNSRFRRVFEPYHLHQIHGTIIGLERLIGFREFFNANKWQDSGEEVSMNYDLLDEAIPLDFSMRIRFGGFDKTYKKFLSLKKKPYERSFQVQWSTGKFTLIGWPHENGDFSTGTLWKLREAIEERSGIRHKYAKDKDNDFFMVLGDLLGFRHLTDQELAELKTETPILEEAIREYLWLNPIELEITRKHIFLAQYEQESLAIGSTNIYCIQDYEMNNSFMQSLYQQGADMGD